MSSSSENENGNVGGRVHAAAQELARSMRQYSEAVFQEYYEGSNAEAVAAKEKIRLARKLVQDSGLAHALGTKLVEEIRFWPSWSKREDFQKWINFSAESISATEHREPDGKVQTANIQFKYKENWFQVIIHDFGWQTTFDGTIQPGEVALIVDDQQVAKFALERSYDEISSSWGFRDILVLKMGPWASAILRIGAEIDARRKSKLDTYGDAKAVETANDIELDGKWT